MDQKEAKAKLAAYLDPKLSDDERAVMEAKILADETVRKELAALESVDASVKAAPAPEAPAGYFDALPGRLSDRLEAEAKTDSVPASAQGMFGAFSAAAAAAEPDKEGSGLKDLKALARTTVTAMDATAQPSLEQLSGPVGRTSVVGMKVDPHGGRDVSTGTSKWVWGAVGGVGVLGAVAAYMFTVMPRADTRVATLEAPAAPTPALAAPPAAEPVAAMAEPAQPEAMKEAGSAAQTKDDLRPSRTDRSRAGKGAGAGSKAAAPASKAEVTPAAPAAAAPASDLDALLAQASRGSKGPKVEEDEPASAKKTAATEAPAEGEGAVSLTDLRKAMEALAPKVRSCFKRYQIGGTAEVTVLIAPSGKLGSATLKGEFLGTPTGECVLNQVKTATFPKFKGNAMSLTYPFNLH